MNKIEIIRTVIFALAAIIMFLAVTHSVFGIGMLPPMLICGVVSCLAFKFDSRDWPDLPGFPIFLYWGAVAGLLISLPVCLIYFQMK